VLLEREYPLSSEEVLFEALTSRDLTVAETIQVRLSCAQEPCVVQMEYLLLAEAVECFDDGGCGRNEICEAGLGRCAECLEDSHCSTQQTCNLDTGRCFPGASGCGSTGDSRGAPMWAFLVALCGLGLFLRRVWRYPQVLASLSLSLLIAMAVAPSVARADQGASLAIGAGPRALTGEVGEATGIGWGIAILQQLRWRSVGASFALGTFQVPIRREDRVGQAHLRGYGISIGPRWFAPLGFTRAFLGNQHPLELSLGADYTRWNVAENRLASITGLGLSFHAVGPTLALIWRWRGLMVAGQASYLEIFEWPGGQFSANFLVGLGI
jgi:hypothetical protein